MMLRLDSIKTAFVFILVGMLTVLLKYPVLTFQLTLIKNKIMEVQVVVQLALIKNRIMEFQVVVQLALTKNKIM